MYFLKTLLILVFKLYHFYELELFRLANHLQQIYMDLVILFIMSLFIFVMLMDILIYLLKELEISLKFHLNPLIWHIYHKVNIIFLRPISYERIQIVMEVRRKYEEILLEIHHQYRQYNLENFIMTWSI